MTAIGRRKALLTAAAALGVMAANMVTIPANAITKTEVEQVCADSQEAYDTYQSARASFQAASGDLEEANRAVEQAEAKETRIRGQYESNQNIRKELEPQVESQALELYMQSVGSGTAGLHFQIYPNGHRGGVINPYYRVAAVCF